ncbi:MAG: T9SS type A sorting domain-containing protein [Bacteroidota bacterium]
MATLKNSFFPLLLLLISHQTSLAQQPFPCSDANGKYTALLVNPNVQDRDDGSIDGSCTFRFITEAVSTTLNEVVFTYVGTGSASPISVVHKINPVNAPGVMNIKAPCNNLDVAFDITTLAGAPLCMIRNVVMPVELVDFQAKVVENGIQLNWITASELNNSGFELERSKNGQDWQLVTFIKGHLTTLETQRYKFIDDSPLNGTSYYRLKQMDTNGVFEYSGIITVEYWSREETLHLFPNPAKAEIQILIPKNRFSQLIEITIFDATGRLLGQLFAENGHPIDIQHLPRGIYTLIAKTDHQLFYNHFLKE